MRPILLLVCLASAGCFLAPGMRMNEGAAEARGRESTGSKDFRVEEITPGLLPKLGGPRESRPRLADPLAGVPPAPYTIAPFDVLQVTVWDHPELTAPGGQLLRTTEDQTLQGGNLVAADGTIFYPYVGVVKVAGLTLPEVRNLLSDKLVKVIAKPQLDVRIAQFRGKRVTITGEVVAPATLAITDVPVRVQDAIAFAKGFTQLADPGNVTLARGGKVYGLDLLALYDEGDLTQNWLLQDGDVINVADSNPNRVFVLGEVRLQQAKPMVKRRMTLAEALGDSGGLDPVAANAGKIYVIRGNYAAPDVYHLDASSPDALLLATQFPLRPRDIVYVSTYNLTKFNRVMLQILPLAQTLYDAAVAADIARRY